MTETRQTDLSWELSVDTGGTFTDCVARAPDGRALRSKVLSTGALRGTISGMEDRRVVQIAQSWGATADVIRGCEFRLLGVDHAPRTIVSFDPATSRIQLDAPVETDAAPGAAFEAQSAEEAPILAARLVTATPADQPLPEVSFRLATTRGTNALLERAGGPTAFFVTAGFADLLRIGTQQRPDLFALDVRTREPLFSSVVEVEERLAQDGSVLTPLDLDALEPEAQRLLHEGIESAAVALLHSYRNPSHERQLARFLVERGFRHVSASAALAPLIKILPRAETAVVDAYLSAVIGGYLGNVRAATATGATRLYVMTSAGGLAPVDRFRPKDSLLSGPAGGVAGAAEAGRNSGFARVIAFDMGGTSTDVARFDEDYEYVYEHEVGDARLMAPALAIESVAAGGGSICSVHGGRLKVGPESARAYPGPACYGVGGPLTITDVNLLLGRLEPRRFRIPVQPDAAERQLAAVQRELREATGEDAATEVLLEGFLDIADERMSDAIRRVSVSRGYDASDYALVAFGGAGGQHACGVARRLGMRTVLLPADAGLLSACGIARAVFERFAERQILRPLPEVEPELDSIFDELAGAARSELEKDGVSLESVEVRRRVAELRYLGQDTSLQVEYTRGGDLREAFEARHAALYGHTPAARAVEVESLRVVVSTTRAGKIVPRDKPDPQPAPEPDGTLRARFSGRWCAAPFYDRTRLAPGTTLRGPAILLEDFSTTVIEDDWVGEIDVVGTLVLRSATPTEPPRRPHGDTGRDPELVVRTESEAVRLELFTNRFRSIATEMGAMLQRTAMSTNVKERLDFSCALLDATGELVVNAPHIPVHLGALGLCVRRLRESVSLNDGDVVVTNHPGFGGSHLPDVTVVTPIFAGGTLLGYAASRAHHAEIGGTWPGSMPPDATRLGEEGVIIPPMYVVRSHQGRWEEIESLLKSSPYPSRAVADNLADLRAQVAANARGAAGLRTLADSHGAGTVEHYMNALKKKAEEQTRAALARLCERALEALENLDDGTPLRVRIARANDTTVIDFTGSGATHPGNLNATPAIVQSAVMYVLRLLVEEELPLNEGILRAVEIRIPEGSVLNPGFSITDAATGPAVVGGNVETSQRLVDTLLNAFELVGCSQGTMNNVVFGNERFGYYETVCGGCGAGDGFDGATATHSHMTNTRITDVEIVEHRYPVRVERFAIRAGSGGGGRFRGGDGVVRELYFLEPLRLSLLTQHREVAPYGMRGGNAGAKGRQTLVKKNGKRVVLESLDGCDVEPGDRLILETPGGGGFGR